MISSKQYDKESILFHFHEFLYWNEFGKLLYFDITVKILVKPSFDYAKLKAEPVNTKNAINAG